MTEISGNYNLCDTESRCHADYLNAAIENINAAGGIRMPVGPCPQDTWGVGAEIQNGFLQPESGYTGKWTYDGIEAVAFAGLKSDEAKNGYFWEVTHQAPLHDYPNDRCPVITYDTVPHDLLYVDSTEVKAGQAMGARIYNCTPYLSRPDKSWASAWYTNVLASGICAVGSSLPASLGIGGATCIAGICFDDGACFTLPESFKNFPDGTTIHGCFAHCVFPNFRCTTTQIVWKNGEKATVSEVLEETPCDIAIYSLYLDQDGRLQYKCLGSLTQEKVSADCWVNITDMAQLMFDERNTSLGYMAFPSGVILPSGGYETDFRALLNSFMVPVKATFSGGQMVSVESDVAFMFEWSLGGCVTELYVQPSYPAGVISEANPPAMIETKSRDTAIGQPVFPPMN